MTSLQEIMTEKVVKDEAERIADEYFNIHEGQCPWCEMKYVQKGRLFNHIVKEHHNRIYRSAFNRKIENVRGGYKHRVERLQCLVDEKLKELNETIAQEAERVADDPIDGLSWKGSVLIKCATERKEWATLNGIIQSNFWDWDTLLEKLRARRDEVNKRLLESPHRNSSSSDWHNIVEAEKAATKAEFYNNHFSGFPRAEYEIEYAKELQDELGVLEAFEDEVAKY